MLYLDDFHISRLRLVLQLKNKTKKIFFLDDLHGSRTDLHWSRANDLHWSCHDFILRFWSNLAYLGRLPCKLSDGRLPCKSSTKKYCFLFYFSIAKLTHVTRLGKTKYWFFNFLLSRPGKVKFLTESSQMQN